MNGMCRIPNAIEKLFAASHCGVAYLGGSLTVGVGASDVSRYSWRALFTEYLYRTYQHGFHCQPSEIMGAVGAMESYVAAFTLPRNVIPAKPDLALIEFCVNDHGAPDERLVLKGLEGIVRQLINGRTRCEVMLVGMGNRQRTVKQDLHRRIAEHYGVPFVDMEGCLFDALARRGESWDSISIEFVEGDAHHLNDRGNRLCFEALREGFESEVESFRAGRRRARQAPVPAPLESDEFEHIRLIDPSKRTKDIELEGVWERKSPGVVPWYFDNLLIGRPGAAMTLRFRGTAVAVFGLVYHNGLKVNAVLDGREIAGVYLKHQIEFGKGMVLAHGLEAGEHELRLTVAPASARHNKLADPGAQIAYFGVADRPS